MTSRTRLVGIVSSVNKLNVITVRVKSTGVYGIKKVSTYNVYDKWGTCDLHDTVIIKKLDVPIKSMLWEVVEITNKYRGEVE